MADEMDNGLTGYALSRNWFDWCFENPDKIRPSHTALYFFIIEHCNRHGWKSKFGLPSEMTKEAIGIRNYRTYSKTLNDLIEWGFIKMIEKSKNQYSSCIIAIVKNTKANTKAYTKATQKHIQKHSQKQVQSIVVIDKPNNLEPINQEPQHPLQILISRDYPNISKLKTQLTAKQAQDIEAKYSPEEIKGVLDGMENFTNLTKKYVSVGLTIGNWLRLRREKNPAASAPNTFTSYTDHL